MSDKESNAEEFYSEASDLIRSALSEYDHYAIREELAARDEYFDALSPREKFFVLLNFLDVHYVRTHGRVTRVFQLWNDLSEKNNQFHELREFELPDWSGKYTPLSDLKSQLSNLQHLPDLFRETLKQAEVWEEYQAFCDLLKEGVLRFDAE
jgi:hypothetical protein